MTSKVHSTTRSTARSILYVATTVQAAEDGAAALESVQTGGERTVQPTTSIDQLRDRTSAVDCVVLETDPATDDDRPEILEAIGATPVVLFADDSYSATAPAGDVDGFVRRDTDDAYQHLVDELERVCEQNPANEGAHSNVRAVATTFESTADLVACHERDRLFEELVDSATDVLAYDYCWLATINFGELVPRAAAPAVPEHALKSISLEDPLGVAFRAREPIQIADLANYEWIEPPFEGARSLCSVPVGDVGVLHVAAERPNAFDSAELTLIEELCGVATTILERNWAEQGVANERDRLRRERERFHEQYTTLRDERDALFTLFRDVSEPMVHYDLDDDDPVVSSVNASFEAVFGVDRETVVGEPLAGVALPNGIADQRARLRDAVDATERRQFDVRRGTPDGVRDFSLSIVPLAVTDAVEAPTDRSGGLVIYEDVTEHRRRERELLAASHRLESIADRIDDDVRSPLNTARGYLELAEKTGDEEHFDVVETAHEQLADRLQELVAAATDGDTDTEPVSLHDIATRSWLTTPTADARLHTQDDRLLEADRDALETLFEYVIRTTIEIEGEDATDAVTVTVGGTDDGFYIAGSRPVDSDESGTDPDPDRLDDTDASAFELEFIEQVADAHDWDIGIAEDDDGTAVAFRGVEPLE
ncbi:diguanylate cyclase [Salinadaptatus halalkaliphilus]|uniref:Diguanylate cyclase n=1 Tax=Salinadaptatus halalkaliphilus TaxID=2419781 RepID=A0A4S3TNF7_9EURY|nr:GAF domain-containing protein [Salinadaptatus halalkaliphilus]THE65716.1 diguanylate cyclase [Salinadaptatus halalkaliphilus]